MSSHPSIILVSGAVIVGDNKILLVRGGSDGAEHLFLLPGGKLEHPLEDPITCARREAKEEAGIDIDIIRPLRTLIVERPQKPGEYAVLMHYLCKRIGDVTTTDDTEEFGWYDIHNLPTNTTPSVREIVKDIL
jgi:ADP-ribose pyrophosphatase YjhB (NUDIX family)